MVVVCGIGSGGFDDEDDGMVMILLPFTTFSVAYRTVSRRDLDSKTTCLPCSIFVESHLTWKQLT